MPTEKLSMRKIRELFRLHYEHGCSNREIAISLGISPSTVSTYLNRAKLSGLTWPFPADWDDEHLYTTLFPPSTLR